MASQHTKAEQTTAPESIEITELEQLGKTLPVPKSKSKPLKLSR